MAFISVTLRIFNINFSNFEMCASCGIHSRNIFYKLYEQHFYMDSLCFTKK